MGPELFVGFYINMILFIPFIIIFDSMFHIHYIKFPFMLCLGNHHRSWSSLVIFSFYLLTLQDSRLLTGVRIRSHICDHKILTFVQRVYRIANIRVQVLNGTDLKRPALENSIIIGFFTMLDCTRKYEGLNRVIWRAPFPMR